MGMNKFLMLALFVILAGWFLAAVISVVNRQSQTKPFRVKTPLTKPEQSVFHRLRSAFPDKIILSQVSMSALVKNDDVTEWYRVNRMYVDYVICRMQDFEVLCVVELDDSSHFRRDVKRRDDIKDRALTEAGINIVRIQSHDGLPTIAELHERLKHLVSPIPLTCVYPIRQDDGSTNL